MTSTTAITGGALVATAALAGPPELTPMEFVPGDNEIAVAIQDQEHVRIEAGGAGYLTIWTDARAVLDGRTNAPGSELSGNQLDIYGQLLDADGEPIGPPIVITNAGRNQEHSDLAWNETAQAWMVAFQGQDPDWYFDQHVYGVRVAADGTVLDEEPILLVPNEGNQYAYYAAVASDGTNWLVIAQQWFNNERTVRGRRVGPDGTPIDAQPVVMTHNDRLIYPDVAFADGVYLVVFQDIFQGNTHGQRFDANLAPLSGEFFIGPGVDISEAGAPRAATNEQRFFVVGRHGHRIESNGTNLDPAGIDLGGAPNAFYLDAGWTGNEWIASMALTINNSLSTYLQRIADDGKVIDLDPIAVENVSGGWPQQKTTVAGRDGEAQIGYAFRLPDGSSATAIRSAHLISGGNVAGLQTISLGMPKQSHMEIVQGPNNERLAVFMSEIDGEMRIKSQRITADGDAIDPEPTVVHAAPFLGTFPRAAWNGEVYLVVWTPGGDDITVGKRVSANNTVIDSSPLLIANNPPAGESYTAGGVGAAGDTFVVGIFHRINFHEPVRYAAFVRVDGTTGDVLDTEPVFVAGGFAREMTGASFNDRAILAWAQYGRHDSPGAYAQTMIVSANGGVTGPIRLSAGPGKSPDIGTNGEQALVAWHDDTTIHQDNIEGRFILSNGSMPESEFIISNAPEEQMFPAVGFDGAQYVVAWNDYRHIDGVQQARSDIWAARVLPDGTVLDPTGFQMTDSPLPEDLPGIGGGGGNAVIMFSALHGLGGVPEIQRLAFRVLGDVGQTAILTGFEIVTGSLLDGDITDLQVSDNAYVHTRSGFGEAIADLHKMEMVVSAVTAVDSPSTLDLTAEARIDQPSGVARLLLRNRTTGEFDQVAQYPIGMNEEAFTIEGIDATNYVGAGGEIDLLIKHNVFRPFLAFTFESFIDWIEIVVR